MRPPEFWSADAAGRDRAPTLQTALAPLGWLYGQGARVRVALAKPIRAEMPVLSIGNLTLGGAGKTPVARAARARLGEGAFMLLRGYGGRSAGPARVLPEASARDVGDEALLHARDGATLIARDRAAGARLAATMGARALILDDGHQNSRLVKDASIVVIDASAGIGNGRVFPAGPLREPLADGLARADGFVLVGDGAAPSWLEGRAVARARLAPLAPPPPGPLVAFAGIARPDKFFDTLRAEGGELAECIPYPDHHPFSDRELTWLARLADERGARLITTEKDWVRLGHAWRARIRTLPVRAAFEDEAAFDALLALIRAAMEAR